MVQTLANIYFFGGLMNHESIGKLIAFYVVGQSTVPLGTYKKDKGFIYSSYITTAKEMASSLRTSIDESLLCDAIDAFHIELQADAVLAFPQLVKIKNNASSDELAMLSGLAQIYSNEAPIKSEFIQLNELLLEQLKV